MVKEWLTKKIKIRLIDDPTLTSLKKKIFFLRIGIYLFDIGLFLSFLFIGNKNGMFGSILFAFFLSISYGFFQLSKRIAYVFFLASLFCFMLGRMTVDFFSKGYIPTYFSTDISTHISVLIFLCLIFLQIGYETIERLKISRVKPSVKNSSYRGDFGCTLRTMAQIVFWMATIASVFVNTEQFVFVTKNSYIDLFKSFNSSLPRVIQIFSNMALPAFAVFLGTCPEKKKCIAPICAWILSSALLLLTGDRGLFVINVALVMIYAFWRQYRDKDTWISNKVLFVCIALVPFAFAGLSFFVYLREGVDIGQKDMMSQFLRFFRASGNSVDILGYGKQFQELFPQNNYTFGELIDYSQYNPIVSAITGVARPEQYTEEYAMSMHSYAHTISYFIFPDMYLLGHGKGSSYIAEVYHDFGYIGVAACNLLYGIFLSLVNRIRKSNPIIIACYLLSLRIILYTPRGPAISPVSYVLNLTTVFTILILFVGAKVIPHIQSRLKRITMRK